jgi:two-component system, sensor histidine kinase
VTKAARSATIANVLAPLLCIPMFKDEVPFVNLVIWLSYMFVTVIVRTWMLYQLEYEAGKILSPERNLKVITYAVGMMGFGWGMGWILLAPDLLMVNRMIYVYMTTAAMIASMFAYSVHNTAFLAFTLPIMLPSLGIALWPMELIPWPFAIGLASLYVVVLSIAKNFSKTFEDSVRLRFRNEHLYQELASERDQSIAANVAKSKFIAAASHDLRQPMHAVNVYLELLNLDILQTKERLTINKIKSSITTLNTMFDSLLNISKLDAHAMQVNHHIFRLKTLAEGLHNLSEAKAAGKGLDFSIDCTDWMIRGDMLLLQQIIGNLVSNAIQYTASGKVEIKFLSEDDCLVIEVSDTGCGIDESEHEKIFNQFYRADVTRAQHDGLGLGLSIVQRLCGLIGAEIRLASALGKGSKFVVATSFLISNDEDGLELHPPLTKKQSLLQSLQGKFIVVVEDNPVIVEAYRQTLADKGASVGVFSEDESAFDQQLETMGRIDCILSDYRLNQTTGDVLIQKLRDSYNEEIPAIIVTADTSPSHINLFAKLNIQVLHKPASFHEVAAAIEKII